MKKIESGKDILWSLAAVVLMFCCITWGISSRRVEANISELALSDVKDAGRAQTEFMKHSLDQQYSFLEGFAAFCAQQKDFSEKEVIDPAYLKTFLTVNRYCTVGVADREGNILQSASASPVEVKGNVAGRDYFREAVYWKDARALSYLTTTIAGDEPRYVFAVPIVRQDSVVGCCFASTEQEFFEEKILGEHPGTEVNCFILDSEGLILADKADAGRFQNGNVLWKDIFSEEESRLIREKMALSLQWTMEGGASGKYYASFEPLGVNGWYAVCMMDEETAAALYRENGIQLRQSFWAVCGLLCAVLLVAAGFWLLQNRKKARYADSDAEKKILHFLGQENQAAFDMNLRDLKLHASAGLTQLLGYELPDNWFSVIYKRKAEHPEFAYQAVLEAYHEAIAGTPYKIVTSALRLADNRLRWISITISEKMNSAGEITGVFGIVKDITEEYTDARLKKEEQEHIVRVALPFIPMAISINLSRNSYTMLNHSAYLPDDFPWRGEYSELLSALTAAVEESSRKEFAEKFSVEKLLLAYEQERDAELEFQIFNQKTGSLGWIFSKAYFMAEKISDDVNAVVVLIDITRQKTYQNLLKSNAAMMRERAESELREIDIMARMKRGIVMKYDVREHKLLVLANGSAYERVDILNGHAPEYAIEKGIVQMAAESTFSSAIYEVDHGAKEGSIRFQLVRDNRWLCGQYQTVTDDEGKPVFALLLISPEEPQTDEAMAKDGTDPLPEDGSMKSLKVLMANLSRDEIEFESEDDLAFLPENEESSYAVSCERFLNARVPDASARLVWKNFLDRDRLLRLCDSGKSHDTALLMLPGKGGELKEVRVDVYLQKNQYDNDIRAMFNLQTLKNEEDAEAALPGPNPGTGRRVEIRTFGYFEVLVDGIPVFFSNEKAKEMLAVLVDRRGGFVTSSEMISYLWEDEAANKTTQSRCRQVANRLKNTLCEYGIEDILENVNGRRRILPEKVDCDFFSFLEDYVGNQRLFNGTYMSNYSWSEETLAYLENYRSR